MPSNISLRRPAILPSRCSSKALARAGVRLVILNAAHILASSAAKCSLKSRRNLWRGKIGPLGESGARYLPAKKASHAPRSSSKLTPPGSSGTANWESPAARRPAGTKLLSTLTAFSS